MDEILFEKIEKLKEEIDYLIQNKEKFLKNLKYSPETKRIVERSIYICCEIVLDIANLLIIKKNKPRPLTYSEAIYKLGDYQIIPSEFAYKFVYIAGIRNFLAHDYLKDTVSTLQKFLKLGLVDIEKFINFVEKKK